MTEELVQYILAGPIAGSMAGKFQISKTCLISSPSRLGSPECFVLLRHDDVRCSVSGGT